MKIGNIEINEEELDKAMEDYISKMNEKNVILEKRFDKFRILLDTNKINFKDLFERIITEHDENYIDSCYSKGYMPCPNNKLEFLYDYIEKNLEPIVVPDFIDDSFPTDVYFFKGMYFATTYGQGSFNHIYNSKKERILTI